MTTPFVAAVDWGTSSFRLWLLDAEGAILGETRSDEGMMKAREIGFLHVLEAHLAKLGAADDLPVIVCGMAGAKQGWLDAAYVDTPARLDDLIAAAVPVEGARTVRILPGVAQRDAARPDVMRGEETQLLGALAQAGEGGLFCLPGTHSKWVAISDRTITHFATFMTGDLYAGIAGGTILKLALEEGIPKAEPSDAAFADAVLSAMEAPAGFTSRLFAVRAGPLLGLAEPGEGPARLSGELIGLELAGARQRFGDISAVTLVGSGYLSELYAAAFSVAGISAVQIDADTAVRTGLMAAAKALYA